jgi:hypothetical protein
MPEFAGALKHCATCGYWGGTRRRVKNNMAIEVDSPSARGNCNERTRNSIPVSANQTCTKHQTWSLLRLR